MMSELMFLFTLSVVLVQSSSLWSSVIIIPISISSIMMIYSLNTFSGLLLFVYIMVFIGGLLVLLVSVTSMSYQEQAFSFNKTLLASLMLLLVFSEYKSSYCISTMSLILWFSEQSYMMTFIMVILVVALVVITLLVQLYKGLIRSL